MIRHHHARQPVAATQFQTGWVSSGKQGWVTSPKRLSRFLDSLYERLVLDSPATEPADLIFVYAGKMERKHFGIELYDRAYAGCLLLSVGRFEVSKMGALNVPYFEELIEKRNGLAPDQRHFFCEMTQRGTRILVPKLQSWNTYGETLGLLDYLQSEPAKKVIIVSTDIHLRRIALTLRRVFGDSGVQFRCCAVPPPQSALSKDRWWTRREDRRYVISETVKLMAYGAILLLPDFILRRCWRWKQ